MNYDIKFVSLHNQCFNTYKLIIDKKLANENEPVS